VNLTHRAMRVLLTLAIAVGIGAAAPIASSAASGGKAVAAKNKCSKLHGKKKKRCKKKLKQQQQQQQQQPAPPSSTPPTPTPTTPGPSGAQLSRDDAGYGSQLNSSRLTKNSEGGLSGGVYQYCYLFLNGQFSYLSDFYSSSYGSGQTRSGGSYEVAEGYRVTNYPDTWAGKVKLTTTSGSQYLIEVDMQGAAAGLTTGTNDFEGGQFSRQKPASQQC
jgi:hypothetical protein